MTLLARTAAQLEDTRALLLVRGVPAGRISVAPADLSDEEDRSRAAAAARRRPRRHPGQQRRHRRAARTHHRRRSRDLRLAFEVNVVAPAALTAAVLPGMLDAGWGRVVNVSSAIAAYPAGMVRGNAYAVTKTALEAHTVNLAAELKGTGVTVNAYRPGGVDTAMQAWIRQQDPGRIGAALHQRFTRNYTEGTLITPGHSAAALLAHLAGDDTGAIWDVSTASVGARTPASRPCPAPSSDGGDTAVKVPDCRRGVSRPAPRAGGRGRAR